MVSEDKYVEQLIKRIQIEDSFLDTITDEHIFNNDEIAEQVFSIAFNRDTDLAELESMSKITYAYYKKTRFEKAKSSSKKAPAQPQAWQQVASSKRGRPSNNSTHSRANEHELYQALEKWWLKMGRPNRTDFMKKLRALNEDTPNEYGLILHSNAVPIKRMVQHEQNNITFTLEHIQKNVLKEFEQKHSA